MTDPHPDNGPSENSTALLAEMKRIIEDTKQRLDAIEGPVVETSSDFYFDFADWYMRTVKVIELIDSEIAKETESSHGYSVGDRVRVRETISAGPSAELPAQHYCDKGEVLIVRKVTGEKRPRKGVWPVYVSHEFITDRSFGVTLDQIESVDP